MTTDAASAQPTAPPPRRVLLLAGCYADAGPAIGLAAALAQRMQAALEGVLALDPRAVAVEGATLVVAGRARGAVMALSRERLTRAYAADARAFRSRLDATAGRLAIRWSFRTDTGALPDLALGLRQPGDAVVLGHRRFLPLRGPVLALEDSAEGAPESAAAIGMVGSRHRRDRTVSIPSPTAMTLEGLPKRTAWPSSSPMALRGVAIGALPLPSEASQVRCAPHCRPSRSVTAAIIAGSAALGPPFSGTW